ncbi:MAG: hypothetical protein M5R40_15840 [Anaerolineae bacterium]|nr:hypothetical protein [Anaerolineae bacterium]
MDDGLLSLLARLLESQGLAIVLIVGGLWWFNAKFWPFITDKLVPLWVEQRRQDRLLMERAVMALERLAEVPINLVPE